MLLKIRALNLGAILWHGSSKMVGASMSPSGGLLDVTKSTIGLESRTSGATLGLSPVAEHFFNTPDPNEKLDPSIHLEESKKGFDELCLKIDHSAAKGQVVYLEDSEADDQWQSLLGISRGFRPSHIFLRGGFWQLRREYNRRIWKHFCSVFGCQMPEIYTIHGEPLDKLLADFDYVEGTGLLEDSERMELMKASSTESEEYLNEVKASLSKLRQILEENDFTTIVVKTAPTGIADILEKSPHLKEKVVIIWTGPMEERKGGGLRGDFNYYQDPEAADKFLKSGVPIVMVSPFFRNTDMTSIIDEKAMDAFREHTPHATKFPGFVGLSEIGSASGAVLSKAFKATAKLFQQRRIELAKKEGPRLDAREQQIIERIQQVKNSKHEGSKAELAKLEAELGQVDDERDKLVSLGARWAKIIATLRGKLSFAEYCPVDQWSEPILNPAMRAQAVKEVIAVNMQPNKAKGDMAIDVSPAKNGNVFVISKWFSEPLALRIQKSIDWMRKGEPKYEPGQGF